MAILSAVAPNRGDEEIRDLRRLVLAAEPTKTYTIPSQVEPKYTCDVCGNRDQTKFLHESKDGDVVCLGIGDQGCGNVVEEHKLFEGNQFRKFEGEEDKSHHGPAPNKLYSAAHNMKTSLVPTGGAGGQRAARLRQASDTMEMGLSNLGTDERKTRTGYKDQMKKKAFDLIAHAASNLNLHDSVVGRAQELFANFRDEREFVQKFDAVVRSQRPTVPSLLQYDSSPSSDEVDGPCFDFELIHSCRGRRGVSERPRRLDAVDAAVRESPRLAREPRCTGGGVRHPGRRGERAGRRRRLGRGRSAGDPQADRDQPHAAVVDAARGVAETEGVGVGARAEARGARGEVVARRPRGHRGGGQR